MRKYDGKNKRNIGIIVGFCIIFAVIFSYFLFQQVKLSKIKYELEASTVLFDIDKNSILLNSTGVIKKKWNKKYYLTYEEEQYNVGTHVIAFNNNETSLSLYGEFYLVNRNSEVDITKEETIINNLGISRFYKIADRKYLIIDPDIKTEDESLKTTNYLIVELDKQGNAILYNNGLNVKVFSATKIITTSYTFDIANELLIYENDTIDLKKILGTTNQYKEEENKTNNDGDDTGDDNIGAEGNGTGQGGQPGDVGGNAGNNDGDAGTAGGNEGNDNDIITDEDGTDISNGEIIDQTAYTSIIRITPFTNKISVDYVIYDKLGDYLSTFVEVRTETGDYNVIYLSKNTTNTSITGLKPGVTYNLTFKYTHMEDDLVREEIIDTQNVTTLVPNITLTGTKVTSKKIDYKIALSYYTFENAKLRLYVNGVKQNKEISINGNNLVGSINISDVSFTNNALVELRLEDIYVGEWIDDDTYIGGMLINKISSWSYKVTNIVTPEPDNPDQEEDETTGGDTDNSGGNTDNDDSSTENDGGGEESNNE